MSQTTITQQPAPAAASRPRTAPISLIVLHSDPQPASDALAAWTAPDARSAPHFFVAAIGTITQLVPETRAARHSGSATWQGRERDIDQISIGITLEHTPGARYPPAQRSALDALLAQLRQQYALQDEAILRWEAGNQVRETGPGTLLPPDVPLVPWRIAPPVPPALVLGPDGSVADPNVICVPPPLLPAPPPPLVLGPPDDPQARARLNQLLIGETYRQRGGGFHGDWAFHHYATAHNLGAPLAPSATTANQVAWNNKRYGYQVFAGDTLFNEIPQWSAVQSMNGTLAGGIPADGLARALLEASFRATGNLLHADWRFHQLAVQWQLGPPLSGNYRITVGQSNYAVQVFAGDTLYTPIAVPDGRTDWGDVRRMSDAGTPDDLRAALWAETYKPCGAPLHPDSLFQQCAASAGLGAPLSDTYSITSDNVAYTVQVFARDTVYASGSDAPQRLSALPDAPGNAAPAAATIDPHDTTRQPVFAMLPVPTSANPRVCQFYGYTHYAHDNGTRFYSQTYGCHSGLDFWVPLGTPLLAVDYGVVECAGVPGTDCVRGGCPPLVIVVRYGAVCAVYGHASAVQVRPGQVVQPGDVLGLSGQYPAGMTHLHFEVRPANGMQLASNPVLCFSPELANNYFSQQLAALGGARHFCCGTATDQPAILFGKQPIMSRSCEH